MSQFNCAAFCDINGKTRVLGVVNIMPLFVTSIHSKGFECHGTPAEILCRFTTEHCKKKERLEIRSQESGNKMQYSDQKCGAV
jgi:hypothetical protein